MPVGQSGESQQWITSSMRLLSLAARGSFLERALQRHAQGGLGPRSGAPGHLPAREDGAVIPMWHDSRVARSPYAIQNILTLRAQQNEQAEQLSLPLPESRRGDRQREAPPVMAGKKCPECGAHAVIRKDGCEYCTQCGHLGSCG